MQHPSVYQVIPILNIWVLLDAIHGLYSVGLLKLLTPWSFNKVTISHRINSLLSTMGSEIEISSNILEGNLLGFGPATARNIRSYVEPRS